MEEIFIEFTNNVFCRRESNQHKAKILWERIKHEVPVAERKLFETEWNHYVMGEFEPNMFGVDINNLKKYFKKLA